MGQTPMMWAAAGGRTEIVRLLIERGAEASAVSKNGYNALLFAAQNGDVECLKALLAAKADPLFKARDGSTAFLIALVRGNEAAARLMLEHGADVNSRDAIYLCELPCNQNFAVGLQHDRRNKTRLRSAVWHSDDRAAAGLEGRVQGTVRRQAKHGVRLDIRRWLSSCADQDFSIRLNDD